MPEHNPGQMGGTLRLGQRKTIFKSKRSVARKSYSNTSNIDNKSIIYLHLKDFYIQLKSSIV